MNNFKEKFLKSPLEVKNEFEELNENPLQDVERKAMQEKKYDEEGDVELSNQFPVEGFPD